MAVKDHSDQSRYVKAQSNGADNNNGRLVLVNLAVVFLCVVFCSLLTRKIASFLEDRFNLISMRERLTRTTAR